MIERVRAGEAAEDVVRGLRGGLPEEKVEKSGSEGLKERTGRFLSSARETWTSG